MVSMNSNGETEEAMPSFLNTSINTDLEAKTNSSTTAIPHSNLNYNVDSNNTSIYANFASSPTMKSINQDFSKMSKLKEMVENSSSASSKSIVDSLIQQITQLSDVEKFLLYLKLPVGRSSDVDPLKQALNPLGSRSEIQLTINWMKTHLQEDSEVSLPKEEVYNEYVHFSTINGFKALSTADFGKVMKQVFPSVRARRLGHRGASKYCHSGLKKKYILDVPSLPDLSLVTRSSSKGAFDRRTSSHYGVEALYDERQKSSLSIVMEWAEKFCNATFKTFYDLALFLLSKNYVNSTSVAALTLMTVEEKQENCTEKHREAQIHLQSKLLEREQKRKMQEQIPPHSKLSSDRPKVRRRSGNLNRANLSSSTSRLSSTAFKLCSKSQDSSPLHINSSNENNRAYDNPAHFNRVDSNCKSLRNDIDLKFQSLRDNSSSSDCINVSTSSLRSLDPGIVIKQENDGSNIKLVLPFSCQSDNFENVEETESLNSPKLDRSQSYSIDEFISSTSTKAYEIDISNVNHSDRSPASMPSCTKDSLVGSTSNLVNTADIGPASSGENLFDSSTSYISSRRSIEDKTKNFSNDMIMQGNSSNLLPPSHETTCEVKHLTSEIDDADKSDQLTELRKLLQRNLPSGSNSCCSASAPVSLPSESVYAENESESDASNSVRRRVSFQTSIDAQLNASSQDLQVSSPTQFRPIYPSAVGYSHAYSSLSQGPSQGSSTNASPFISPRNTPLARSRHNSGQKSSTYVCPKGQFNVDQSSNYIISDQGSPFMSPASTPILSRSRNNSNQNLRSNPYPTVCRSRNSSGTASYRHTPYYTDDFFGRRSSKYRSRHSSGGIPLSPQSAPLSPLVHDSSVAPLSDANLFRQYHMGSLALHGSFNKHLNLHAPCENVSELRRRHMSAGPTIHYQPTSFSTSAVTSLPSSQDSFSQELTEVMNNPITESSVASLGFTNRPQSVPLLQMQNSLTCTSDLDCPAKSHPNTPLVAQAQQFNFGQEMGMSSAANSRQSSYAPTPVPSEFNDFCDYSTNFELDSVLASEASGVNSSGFESMEGFRTMSEQPDHSASISETSFPSTFTYSENCLENRVPSSQGSSDFSTSSLPLNSGSSIQDPVTYNGSSQITLNTLNSTDSAALLGFGFGEGTNSVGGFLDTSGNDDFLKVDFGADSDSFGSLVLDPNKSI